MTSLHILTIGHGSHPIGRDLIPSQQFFRSDHIDAQFCQVRAQFVPLGIVSKVERLGPTAALIHKWPFHGIGQESTKVVHIWDVLQNFLSQNGAVMMADDQFEPQVMASKISR